MQVFGAGTVLGVCDEVLVGGAEGPGVEEKFEEEDADVPGVDLVDVGQA
jgi:hypothetical protein